jgi:hypothetical protein
MCPNVCSFTQNLYFHRIFTSDVFNTFKTICPLVILRTIICHFIVTHTLHTMGVKGKVVPVLN